MPAELIFLSGAQHDHSISIPDDQTLLIDQGLLGELTAPHQAKIRKAIHGWSIKIQCGRTWFVDHNECHVGSTARLKHNSLVRIECDDIDIRFRLINVAQPNSKNLTAPDKPIRSSSQVRSMKYWIAAGVIGFTASLAIFYVMAMQSGHTSVETPSNTRAKPIDNKPPVESIANRPLFEPSKSIGFLGVETKAGYFPVCTMFVREGRVVAPQVCMFDLLSRTVETGENISLSTQNSKLVTVDAGAFRDSVEFEQVESNRTAKVCRSHEMREIAHMSCPVEMSKFENTPKVRLLGMRFDSTNEIIHFVDKATWPKRIDIEVNISDCSSRQEIERELARVIESERIVNDEFFVVTTPSDDILWFLVEGKLVRDNK